MRVRRSIQRAQVEDPVRSKLAMVVPILEATVHSLARDRIERLGGTDRITLHDVAREYREGHGDTGICFEYAVHEAIANNSPAISPLASEVLEDHCSIPGGAQSILFGPEKEGVIPILESVRDALTDDSVVYVGNPGRPPKVRRYIPQIVRAYRRLEERNNLPRSISGIWKADLFLGNTIQDAWIGTTVKINPAHLQGARGLRVGIYPKQDQRDTPRRDEELNLIRLPLPYDGAFMELFYKSFFLTRAFLRADAEVPTPVDLPDAEDRFITQELRARREFPAQDVFTALREMSQPDLLETTATFEAPVDATISEEHGLDTEAAGYLSSESVSIAPEPR